MKRVRWDSEPWSVRVRYRLTRKQRGQTAIPKEYMANVPYEVYLHPSKGDDIATKVTFRTMQSTLRELKHIAADKNVNVTQVMNDALIRYIKSYNVSTFKGDSLRDAVAELTILTMKRLKQETRDDETVKVDINSIYEEACAEAGSPGAIGSYDSANQTLRNRVLQELFGREYIKRGTTEGKVTITYRGKISPEFV